MRGQISISLEREPSYFAADAIAGSRPSNHCGDRSGPSGLDGERFRVPLSYINGEPIRVGYLGGLRLDHTRRGRFDIVRRGFEFLRELHADDPLPLYLTSIIADNDGAVRLLERGLPRMPTYRRLGEWITLIMSIAVMPLWYSKPAQLMRPKKICPAF